MSTLLEHTQPRLLVIDDEPGICLAISLLLQEYYGVVTANSAEEALARLTEPYELILLDLRMPGVEGYGLLNAIRAKAGNTPIIILSALGDRRTRDDVMQHGAMTLIEKPFSRQELLERIQDILHNEN